ncbi:MAG: HlyC/CorC family transporter [Holosporales bacterium]
MDIPLYIAIPAVLLLTVMSAMFSASETSFVGASNARLHRLQKKGNKRASTVLKLRNNMGKLVGTILFSNIMLNNLATSLSTSVLVGLFGEAGVAYATIIMTLLLVIYADVAPKIYVITNMEKAACRLSMVIAPVVRVFGPIASILEKIARASLRLLGARTERDARVTSSLEELRGAIDMHHGPDAEIAEERAMLHSILDLGDIMVAEIMIHRKTVFMLDADLPPEEILEQVITSPFTRIPLYRGNPDNIVGILHAKAVLRYLRQRNDKDDAFDIMSITSQPWFVPDSTTLQEQLRAFRQRKEHIAMVVDEYGVFEGVVTLEDILEEIVGDISDEHDVMLPGVWVNRKNEVIVAGTTTVRDLNRRFGWELPDEEAATIAGLVLYEVREIPEAGQDYHIHGFRISVLRRTRNQLTLLKLTPPSPADKVQNE